jgi:hypothetical protein
MVGSSKRRRRQQALKSRSINGWYLEAEGKAGTAKQLTDGRLLKQK